MYRSTGSAGADGELLSRCSRYTVHTYTPETGLGCYTTTANQSVHVNFATSKNCVAQHKTAEVTTPGENCHVGVLTLRGWVCSVLRYFGRPGQGTGS